MHSDAAGNQVRLDLVAATDLVQALSPAAWDDLAAEASEPNPFFERWFVGPSLAHLPHASRLHFALLWRGERLDGLMPLSQTNRYGKLPLRHITNHLHHNVFLGTPLARRGSEAIFWEALLPALDNAKWAKGLLRLTDLSEGGPVLAALQAQRRRCETIHRHQRAFLESPLGAEAYYAATVRKKKRKEIKRLQARLAEMGAITCDVLAEPEEARHWCNQFLALERSGWKGVSGSALADDSASEAFFRHMVDAGLLAGRIEILRYSLDGRPLAMLVNFMTEPGSFSFKIAFDEDYARFSPGVMIQLENLKLLERPGFGWMDSCAVPDHPMINSLWGERRGIIWKALPLAGAGNAMTFKTARLAERSWDWIKARRASPPNRFPENEVEGSS